MTSSYATAPMTDTKEFDVIRVARSDGADTGPGYWPVTAPPASNNAKKPSKEAVEKTPRAKPQMVRLAEDDPRFVEWRIKLGILLKQEVSPTPDEGNAWYVHFPKGYWLYEKSKHLWVSGYPVKAKLFKSPQEFGVHLLWLFSSSKEYADCCCVHCNAPNPAKALASEDPAAIPSADPAVKGSDKNAATRISPVPLPPLPGQTGPPRPANIASRPQSAAKFQPQQRAHPVSTTPQTPAASILPATPLATPQPQPHPSQHLSPQAQQQQQQQLKSQSQPQQSSAWSLKAPQTFRAGELVWFQTGNTWRLGIVASPSPGGGAGPYELLPLGHAMLPQPNVSKPESDLRPFHCFSVPSVDVPELKGKTFDEVPWDAVFAAAAAADPVRRDHICLDASKMAASKIDSSFSLWTRRSEDPLTKTVTYHGCFFGAERIELGDCIRVKGGDLGVPHAVVMGLCHIFVPTAGEYAGRMLLRGHVYYLSKGPPAPNPNPNPNSSSGSNNHNSNINAVIPEDKLPVALREEIQWRKSIAPAQQWCAVLLRENIVLKEQSVRGRFYPTHRLLPLYDPVGYGGLVQSGQLRDQHVYLNNRMDAGGQYIGRKRNRLDTLGASVPQAARLAVEQHVMEEV